MAWKKGTWSDDDSEELLRLIRSGVPRPEIKRRFPERTPGAVEARIRWLAMSENDRQRHNEYQRNHDEALRKGLVQRKQYNNYARSHAVPERVLEERDRRMAAPLTTSAFVMGDPPVGFSALDRPPEKAPPVRSKITLPGNAHQLMAEVTAPPGIHPPKPPVYERLVLLPLGAPTFKRP